MKSLLVSACLLGENCKYSGGNNILPDATIEKLRKKFHLVPVCPEVMGGLGTPRLPSEILGKKVFNSAGSDVTGEYEAGAKAALEAAVRNNCSSALLKERSPSCGFGKIYDGSFTGTLIEGNGVTSTLLSNYGIEIFGESGINRLLQD